MATKVVMEALSPTMEEGRLVKWLKNEGDAVAQGDVLAEVETDKAIMELVARGEGVLRARMLGEGDSAPVGQTIAVIAGADEDISALVQGAGTAAGAGAAPAGEVVAQTRETAGASPVPATPAQAQGEASMPPQQKAPAAPGGPRAPVAREDGATAAPPSGDGERLRSSPLARRLASERGLALDGLRGSGPGGRIIKRDIEAALEGAPAAAAAPAVAAPAPTAEAAYADVPLSQMRKTIARRLTQSIGPVPHFFLTI